MFESVSAGHAERQAADPEQCASKVERKRQENGEPIPQNELHM
jgi:hypothetical protein